MTSTLKNFVANITKGTVAVISKTTKRLRALKFNLVFYLSLFIAGMLAETVTEAFKIMVLKYLSKNVISYQVLSISKHKKYELTELMRKQEFSTFNMNLDDPILLDYYVAKIRLINLGPSLKGILKFNVELGRNNVKIIDIKHKVRLPPNKTFPMTHSLPPLICKAPVKDGTVSLTWGITDPKQFIRGFNIYRSFKEDVGFGTINDTLVLKPSFKIPIRERISTPLYYTITSVGIDGSESEFSENPVKFPDIIAFLPGFEDVYWIDSRVKMQGSARDGSKGDPFGSLSEGIARAGKDATFIIRAARPGSISSEYLTTKSILFYEDDLLFLKGVADISLLNGMDEDAVIDLLVFKPVITLHGAPGVELRWIKTNQLSRQAPVSKTKDTRKLVTPRAISAHLGKKSIYLVWEKPKDPRYKAVRIFRSPIRTSELLVDPGKELYDGPGTVGIIQCKIDMPPLEQIPSVRANGLSEYKPPPRKADGSPPPAPFVPSAPYGLKVSNGNRKVHGEQQYFEDRDVTPGVPYTYTVFAYNENRTYSYPILINATLTDSSPQTNCLPKPKGNPEP